MKALTDNIAYFFYLDNLNLDLVKRWVMLDLVAGRNPLWSSHSGEPLVLPLALLTAIIPHLSTIYSLMYAKSE